MIRRFINQDKLSNKFWNVEIDQKAQKITFGKIGTTGRETLKVFSSEEECLKETEKLISEKKKKGYIEMADSDSIPDKVDLSIDEKAEIYFWEAIKKSNKYKSTEDYDVDEHIDNLTEYLSKGGKEKIILFEKCLQEKISQLYTAELFELAIILECEFKNENGVITFDDFYVSTDGFVYFRCWLLLQGQDFFNEITQNINIFIGKKYGFAQKHHFAFWCFNAEGLLYASEQAYAMNNDNDELNIISDEVQMRYPDLIHYDSEDELNRDPIAGDRLQEVYPELVADICKWRSL